MTFTLLMCALLMTSGGESEKPADTSGGDSLSSVMQNNLPSTDSYFEMVESESGHLLLLDDLQWLQDHPYDLNAVSAAELESIPGVTPYEARELLRYRRAIGAFVSASQIREVKEVGEQLYEKLVPYVMVKRAAPLVQLRSRSCRDLEPRRGYMDHAFVGSSLKPYACVSVEAGNFEMGAVAEKDAGEPLMKGFLSGYISARNMGPLSQLVVGDFNVEAGQGLVFWKGSSFGKGSEAVSIVNKSGRGIHPYHSTDEFNFFRGVATSASLGKVSATAFLSQRILDGSVDSLGEVTSLYDAGLFQTQSDLAKRHAVTERVVGGRIEVADKGNWLFGCTGYHSVFDKVLTSDRVYEFAGRTQDVIGLDAAVSAGRLSAFGEAAGAGDKALAGIVGTILDIGPRSSMAIVYRSYSPAFSNIHASSFGEHSNAKNEHGLYFGADVRPLQWLRISGYVDQFRFPWRTYLDPMPTAGHEVLLQTDAKLSPRIDLCARFSQKSTEGAEAVLDPEGRDIRPITDRVQEKYRLTLTCNVSPQMSVKGRIELTNVRYAPSGASEKGYVLFQDFRYAISRSLCVEGRLVFFQTDSYDSRLYEYENDLSGVFSNPGLYGKGRRWYVVLRYATGSSVILSARYREMQKEGVTSMGTGPSEILGDVDNAIALQIDLRL